MTSPLSSAKTAGAWTTQAAAQRIRRSGIARVFPKETWFTCRLISPSSMFSPGLSTRELSK